MEDFGYFKKEKQNDNLGFTKKIFLIAASLFSIACFVYVTINAYKFIYLDDKNTETIESPEGPIKVIENNEDEKEAVVNRSVYEDIFGNQSESLKKTTPKLRDVPQPAIPPQIKQVTSKDKDINNSNNKIEVTNNTKKEATSEKPEKIVIYSNSQKETQKQDLLEKNSTKKNTQVKANKNNGIKVQIAAMTSKKSAEDYWEKLNKVDSRIFSNLDSFIEEVDLGKRGIFYRLQIGAFFNQVEADNFCNKYIAKMHKTRADCIIVE